MEEFSDARFKQRAVIELLTKEKVPPIEIHRRMQAVYGDHCHTLFKTQLIHCI
jgi:hypothetical protein